MKKKIEWTNVRGNACLIARTSDMQITKNVTSLAKFTALAEKMFSLDMDPQLLFLVRRTILIPLSSEGMKNNA